MAVREPQIEAAASSVHGLDPRKVADLALAAAVRAHADAVYIEPADSESVDEPYVITLERGPQLLTTVRVDAQLGAAVIARLAFLADIDLSSSHAASGVLPVRSGNREADIVITVRPGSALCANLMVMPRGRPRAQTIELIGPIAGDQIGQYRVLEFLGEGGMG